MDLSVYESLLFISLDCLLMLNTDQFEVLLKWYIFFHRFLFLCYLGGAVSWWVEHKEGPGHSSKKNQVVNW